MRTETDIERDFIFSGIKWGDNEGGGEIRRRFPVGRPLRETASTGNSGSRLSNSLSYVNANALEAHETDTQRNALSYNAI